MNQIKNFIIEKWEFIINIFDKNSTETGHLPQWLMNEFTFIVLIVTTIYGLSKLIKKIRQSYLSLKIKRLLHKDLSYSSFSRSDVEKATKYYIPTNYQNVSPSDDEEPGSKYIASAKNKLIPLFLKEAFSLYGNDNKYFLILADAGMGKTTFMINLYLAYKRYNYKNLRSRGLNILLYSLGDGRTIDRISKIENKNETILLLDAFDEDTQAIKDYKIRMSEILKVVDDFHDIVITSRTQFFPSEVEEPYSTGYLTFGDANTKRNFQKLYLSVFDSKDVKKYLRKRIPFYKTVKYKKALEITQKSPSLVVRPMLLSHIEDLASSDEDYNYTYQIYQVLIEKWVEREAIKPGLEQKYGKNRYQELLKVFSQDLAVDMYVNKENRKGYYADIKEFQAQNQEFDIEDFVNEVLSDVEKRSRSLLNRDAEGNYKFSHKSIMEFFLAKALVEDKAFLKSFDFNGNDAAYLFYKEMLINEKNTPIYEKYSSILSQNSSIEQRKVLLLRKYKVIRKSSRLSAKYEDSINHIYNQPLKITSGLKQFDFLYKIVIYNKILNNSNGTIRLEDNKPVGFAYELSSNQLKSLQKDLNSLKGFYFPSDSANIIESTLENLNEAFINYKTRKVKHTKTLDLENIIFKKVSAFLLETFWVLNRKKNSKVFFQNQSRLISQLESSTNEEDIANIEFLIAFTNNLYTQKYYKDYLDLNLKISVPFLGIKLVSELLELQIKLIRNIIK